MKHMVTSDSSSEPSPEPSPSPGPSPKPPESGVRAWLKLEPPPGASNGLVSYIANGQTSLLDLVDLLGDPEYAVDAPVAPPASPPELGVGDRATLTGVAGAAYSTNSIVLQDYSTAWQDMDNNAVTVAQHAASIGQNAIQQIKQLVEALKDILKSAHLIRTLPASYTGTGSVDGLSSYPEYRLALAVSDTIYRAANIVQHAAAETGQQNNIGVMPILPIPNSIPHPPSFSIPQPKPGSRVPFDSFEV